MGSKDRIRDEKEGMALISFLFVFGHKIGAIPKTMTPSEYFNPEFLEQLKDLHVSKVWRKELQNVINDPHKVKVLKEWSVKNDIFAKVKASGGTRTFKDIQRVGVEVFARYVLCAPLFEQKVFKLFDAQNTLISASSYVDQMIAHLEEYKDLPASVIGVYELMGEISPERPKEEAKIRKVMNMHSPEEWRKRILDYLHTSYDTILLSKRWLERTKVFNKGEDPIFSGDTYYVTEEFADMLRDAFAQVSGLKPEMSQAAQKFKARKDLHHLLAQSYAEFILINPQT